MEALGEIASNFGIVGIAVLIVLDKMGLLDRLLPKKNGNGNGHHEVKKVAEDAAKLLATNHFHEVPEILKDIRDSQRRTEENLVRNFNNFYTKIDSAKEDLTYLRARSNGRH